MKINLEPTGRFEHVNGTRCRIWQGETDKGVPVTCFIPLVQVDREDDNTEFERELDEVQTERQPVVFEHRFII
jgi:hypothetical protein